MKLKIAAVVLALTVVCGFAFAQSKSAKSATKAAAEKKVPVTVIALTNNQFGSSDASLNTALERYLEAPLEITVIDREDALKDPKYQGYNLDFMPLYLVKRTPVVNEKFKEDLSKGLPATDEYVILEKSTRSFVYANKEPKPNQLDLFVMSQCPYGVMAENKLIAAKKAGLIPDYVNVQVHFIVSPGRTEDTFNSLHGTAEWEEDVRQAIVQAKYPKKFWKYLEEFNKDYRTTRWDVVAEKAGLNPNIFRKYWADGVKILKEDMKLNQEFAITGSPSIVWEGRVKTDMGALATIPGFEGLNQAQGQGVGAQVPQGQC